MLTYTRIINQSHAKCMMLYVWSPALFSTCQHHVWYDEHKKKVSAFSARNPSNAETHPGFFEQVRHRQEQCHLKLLPAVPRINHDATKELSLLNQVTCRNSHAEPTYIKGTDSVQYIGPISLQQLAGVTIPIDVAHVYILDPLAIAAQSDQQVGAALQTFTRAGAKQQADWEDTYTKALGKATGILTAIFVLFPFLPYLKRLPYYLGVHHLIWRDYYSDVQVEHKVAGTSPDTATV